MKYITYYRVSTKDQNLGIAAQKAMVNNFIKSEDIILASFEEKESGKNDNRPELIKALEMCKRENAVLLIAKIDRLSRKLSFIANLMDSGVKFVAMDMPEANEFTIHIFAALAQQERKFISERTASALKEIKNKIAKEGHHISKNGNKIESLGSPVNHITDTIRKKAVDTIKSKALNNDNNKRAKEMVRLLKEKNMSLQEIANQLNISGFKTSKGYDFKAMSVKRLLA